MGLRTRSGWKFRAAFAASLLAGSVALCAGAAFAMQGASSAEQPDPYIWLEQVTSPRAMAWVKQQDAHTDATLKKEPNFAYFDQIALKQLQSPDRLATPDLRAGQVYNLWRDAQHVRGILRRTTLDDYRTPEPHWTTVLDYDALARSEGQNWFPSEVNCIYPGNGHCMIGLSEGGEDATTLREFDLKSGHFVANGFTLPHSKQSSAWQDANTLLLARDWGAGTMTTSGYPFVIKRLQRGEPLSAAKEVFRGLPGDVGASPQELDDAQGHHAMLLVRHVTFFTTKYFLLTARGPEPLAMPAKAEIAAMLDGQLIIQLHEDWSAAGQKFKAGSVVSVDLAAAQQDPAHLEPSLIFAPTEHEFAQTVDVTRDDLVLTTLANVQGRAYVYARATDGTWSRHALDVPANESVELDATDDTSNHFVLAYTGFLSPTQLELGDGATGTLAKIKALPARFDASNLTVDQLWATSKDGTLVPYFVVHARNMPYDGTHPTLLTAYGGFEVSMTPYYSGITGKLWLERGGVLVLANIRGGGEFGPAWHEAGLTTHRQRIYDDFAAVGADLVKRRITSPERLGIEGGSNGGLLMGVELTQHPEMWKAVSIEVPLLDMLRFEKIAAGSSWVGEYGSVSVPAQRKFLASISPYNQLRPGVKYPTPLIFTTTRDDRVGPVHARKFAARMEEFHDPFYYEEITEGGHNVGANLAEDAATDALIYTYFVKLLTQ